MLLDHEAEPVRIPAVAGPRYETTGQNAALQRMPYAGSCVVRQPLGPRGSDVVLAQSTSSMPVRVKREM